MTLRRASWLGLALLSAACNRAYVPAKAIRPIRTIAIDTLAGTVTLPLHGGRVGDRHVWYVVTESSDQADAARRGVTWAPRMAALATSKAVQPAVETADGIVFTAGVNFKPELSLRAAPDSGFPRRSPPGIGR